MFKKISKTSLPHALLYVFLFSHFANAGELRTNLTIYDKATNKTQKTSGYISVDNLESAVSGFRVLSKGRKTICSGTRKMLVARSNFLSGTFRGKCFGFNAGGKWSQTGVKARFRWEYNGSWIEAR